MKTTIDKLPFGLWIQGVGGMGGGYKDNDMFSLRCNVNTHFAFCMMTFL